MIEVNYMALRAQSQAMSRVALETYYVVNQIVGETRNRLNALERQSSSLVNWFEPQKSPTEEQGNSTIIQDHLIQLIKAQEADRPIEQKVLVGRINALMKEDLNGRENEERDR